MGRIRQRGPGCLEAGVEILDFGEQGLVPLGQFADCRDRSLLLVPREGGDAFARLLLLGTEVFRFGANTPAALIHLDQGVDIDVQVAAPERFGEVLGLGAEKGYIDHGGDGRTRRGTAFFIPAKASLTLRRPAPLQLHGAGDGFLFLRRQWLQALASPNRLGEENALVAAHHDREHDAVAPLVE